MIVRDLRPQDFSDIVEYYYRFYDEVKEDPFFGITLFHSKPTIGDELEWFSSIYKQMEEGNAVATIAEEGSHVVGFCEVSRLMPNHDVSHRASLGIHVRKEKRGKGVGDMLLSETLKRCNGKFEIIELSVFTTNEVAKKLYRKFGFRTFGTRPRSIKRG